MNALKNTIFRNFQIKNLKRNVFNYKGSNSSRNFFSGVKDQKIQEFEKMILSGKKKDQNEEFYEPEIPLIFDDKNAYQVLLVSETLMKDIKKLEVLIYPGLAIAGLYAFWSLIHLRFIRTIISTLLYGVLNGWLRGVNLNKKKIIHKIELLDNGTTLRISFLNQAMNYSNGSQKPGHSYIEKDISLIRRLNIEEISYFNEAYPSIIYNFIPIVIDDDIYLLDIKSLISDQDLWQAISSGKYIKINREDVVNKSEAIDIGDFNQNNKL